jgi:hypothetical protein
MDAADADKYDGRPFTGPSGDARTGKPGDGPDILAR